MSAIYLGKDLVVFSMQVKFLQLVQLSKLMVEELNLVRPILRNNRHRIPLQSNLVFPENI